MSTEVRVAKLEQRVTQLETDRHSQVEKIDKVLQAVVDMHDDLRRLDGRVARLETNLPDIIARAVAPLLVRRED
jgi:uncharacterized coiled-coil protein SlyX